MRIVADTDLCVGAGQCVLSEPTVFEQSDDDGTVVLLTEEVDGPTLARVRQAVRICPSGALSLVADREEPARKLRSVD